VNWRSPVDRGDEMDITECPLMTQSGSRIFVTRGDLQLGGRASVYSSDWMVLSSRKRIALSLLVSAITKRTRPCLEVSA